MTDAYTLTLALGGRWSGDTGMTRCPAHEDHSPSLSLANGADGRLLLYCHAGCAFRDIRDALSARGLIAGGMPQPIRDSARILVCQAAARQVARRAEIAQSLWNEAAPVSGSLAERYLTYRGITAPLPSTLRYVRECWHPSATRLPAMVCNVTGADHVAVHRTYLRTDGRGKANVAPTKAMLGRTRGGAVRLSEVPGPLVVTEGIETGLSLLSGLLDGPATVWAALSAGGMQRLRLPDQPGKLVLAADGDPVGQAAAHALASRADALGWCVSFLTAPDGKDWNDVLTGKAVRA